MDIQFSLTITSNLFSIVFNYFLSLFVHHLPLALLPSSHHLPACNRGKERLCNHPAHYKFLSLQSRRRFGKLLYPLLLLRIQTDNSSVDSARWINTYCCACPVVLFYQCLIDGITASERGGYFFYFLMIIIFLLARFSFNLI